MKTGHVSVHVHSASLEAPPAPAQSLFCVAEIEHFGRRQTRNTDLGSSSSKHPGSSSRAAVSASWEENLAFFVGPNHLNRSKHLKLVLFCPTGPEGGGGREYVAAGSLGLDPLLESDQAQQRVTLPVVDEVGRHAGEVNCTLSFQSSSTDRQQPGDGAQAAHAC